MNTDLKEMFNEKNQSLFFNKLIMDIDNNADTFKLATKNVIKIEIAKLLSTLRKMYADYSVTIEEEKIKQVLSKCKNTLLEDVNILIDRKSDDNKEYINNTSKNDTINSKYIKGYCKHIDSVESSFEDTLKLAVIESSDGYLYTELVRLYPCISEAMQQDLLAKINVNFSNNLIKRITDESIHRNKTLKNISDETYKNYLNLSKNSSNIEKNAKVKVIKNN